jgi:hypothetical protein
LDNNLTIYRLLGGIISRRPINVELLFLKIIKNELNSSVIIPYLPHAATLGFTTAAAIRPTGAPLALPGIQML